VLASAGNFGKGSTTGLLVAVAYAIESKVKSLVLSQMSKQAGVHSELLLGTIKEITFRVVE
jgi:hypothetical protein